MGSNWVWLFVALMFVSLDEGLQSQGCWEQERLALLQIKKHFLIINENINDDLENWVEGGENLDCCRWERVECNNKTGRVIKLNLADLSWGQKEWYLNASLFSPFQQLKSLDLSDNSIIGFIENEGLEKLSTLSNLEFLDLSWNRFNNSGLSSLPEFSSLRYLYLSYNSLEGTVNVEGLHSSSSLEELNMRGNEIDNFMFKGLSNLKYLDLSGNRLNNSVISSITSLSLLTYLSLSYNILKGTVDIQGLHSSSSLEELDMRRNEIDNFMFKGLRNLEYLDLSYNGLNNMSILSSLEVLPALEILDLKEIAWKGAVDLQKPDSFSNLLELDLSHNVIDKFEVPKDYRGLRKLETLDLSYITSTDNANNLLQSLGSFPSLKKLDLSYSKFSGAVPTSELLNFTNLEDLSLDESVFHTSPLPGIVAFTSLKRLSMKDCEVNGSLNAEDLCELVHLRELYMSNNDLRGPLPGCFANFTSLHLLDLSFNRITGTLSPLKDLTFLEDLQLSNNLFDIPISLEPLFNLSKLKTLDGENNQIYAQAQSHSLTPKFQLRSVKLSGYGDGRLLPKFLYHQHELHEVDLSHINLKGEFPCWLLENNTELEVLKLVDNSFSGPLRLPTDPQMYLQTLDISNNFFDGHIPIGIGGSLPRLKLLNTSINSFDGEIPSSFGDMRSLQTLDLSNNRLLGQIPEQLAMNCVQLEILALSNNSLQGYIFSERVNLKNLVMLQLDGNQFIGEIPRSLSKCTLLRGLYLSDNQLSGMIPEWLANLSNLVDIIMPNNRLEGPIPTEICQLRILEVLDLSNNSISGSLPSCSSPLSVKRVHLSRNRLQGLLKDALYFSFSLATLDLSHNHLNGGIPKQIDKLSNLSYLILANNSLEGDLPIQLCQLENLRLIDLSHNNLSGQILACLDFTALHGFSVGRTAQTSTMPCYVPGRNRPYCQYSGPSLGKQEVVDFTTKSISYSYQGKVLTYMSGLDLSCNKLTGKIPYQIGNLTGIRALNLSHNNLIGRIPETLANLKLIESIDLSHNKLNGRIPPQLVELNSLAVFSVAYNNLSGKTPKEVDQFLTFENTSYEGNPFLCGWPLSKSCDVTGSTILMPKASSNDGEDGNFIDMKFFYISFIVTYIIALLAIAIVLYVNPYWRKSWFYFVEMWMMSCYCFVLDHLPN